MRLTDGQTEFR